MTLAHFTIVHLRAWAHQVRIPWVNRELQIERLESEAALLREQLRIINSRYDDIPANRRAHCLTSA